MASEQAVIGDTLRVIIDGFTALTNKADLYLGVQESCAKKLKTNIKSLYDVTKSTVEDKPCGDALPELITENFDDEQIWQEIELQNEPSMQEMLARVARCVAGSAVTFDANTSFGRQRAGDENSGDDINENEDAEESDEEDMVLDGKSASEEESDADDLRLDNSDDSEMSEEERELEKLLDKVTAQNREESGESEDDSDVEGSDVDPAVESEPAEKQSKVSKSKKPESSSKRKTVVDDKFFKLADMEKFLESEDLKEERKHSGKQRLKPTDDYDDDEEEEDEIDVFAELPSDDEAEVTQSSSGRYMYTDFFDPPDGSEGAKGPKKKKVKFSAEVESSSDDGSQQSDEGDEDGEDEAEGDEEAGESSEGEDAADIVGGDASGKKLKEVKSSFEERQERLKKKIADLEEAALSDKPWQLGGEITATARPENSLLQEDLDFEHTTKLPPVITEETSASLESIIKQRIKDKAWDDVERKVKKTEQPYEYKKRIVLDQEKSKLGLGEIYEKEYLKQAQEEEEDKPDPDHQGIQKMMQSLFVKLDALSNFHYTPKPAAPEVQIVSNLPSITMEEVAPVATGGSTTMLAPQEIQEPEKAEPVGDTEKTDTDRKRERRTKKKKQKLRQEQKLKKEELREKKNLGLANKGSKAKALRDLEKKNKSNKSLTIVKDKDNKKSKLTSSTKFFGQLQEEVTTHIESKKAEKRKKMKDKGKSAAAFKL